MQGAGRVGHRTPRSQGAAPRPEFSECKRPPDPQGRRGQPASPPVLPLASTGGPGLCETQPLGIQRRGRPGPPAQDQFHVGLDAIGERERVGSREGACPKSPASYGLCVACWAQKSCGPQRGKGDRAKQAGWFTPGAGMVEGSPVQGAK